MKNQEAEEIKDLIEQAGNAVINEQSNLRKEVIKLWEVQQKRLDRMQDQQEKLRETLRKHKEGHLPGVGVTIAIVGVLMTFVAPVIGAIATIFVERLVS